MDFASAFTFSLSRPGTSHSLRAAGTWLSSASGTVSVMPSRGEPGSKWYSTSNRFGPSCSTGGKFSVVIPAASWRIRSSRDR